MRAPSCIAGRHRECVGAVEIGAESRSRPCSCSCHRKTEPARRTEIPAPVRAAVRRRSRGRCEARLPDVCTGTAEHVHHVVRLSQGGTDDVSNLLDLCLRCHGWVHDHPADARRLGLLRRRPTPTGA